MSQPREQNFGSLMLRFADGTQQAIDLTTREEYERAARSVDAGEAVNVRLYSLTTNEETGAFHAPAGAVVALTFRT